MSKRWNTYYRFLGIASGISLGYIFALDVSGWYFVKPLPLLLMEIVGAIAMYRVTIGLMEDEKISRPAKRGFIWAITGLLTAHLVNMGYLYLKDLQASFKIESLDFSETLAMSWAYMHFTLIGFIIGALSEYSSQGIKKISLRRRERRAKRLMEIKEKREITSPQVTSEQ